VNPIFLLNYIEMDNPVDDVAAARENKRLRKNELLNERNRANALKFAALQIAERPLTHADATARLALQHIYWVYVPSVGIVRGV